MQLRENWGSATATATATATRPLPPKTLKLPGIKKINAKGEPWCISRISVDKDGGWVLLRLELEASAFGCLHDLDPYCSGFARSTSLLFTPAPPLTGALPMMSASRLYVPNLASARAVSEAQMQAR